MVFYEYAVPTELRPFSGLFSTNISFLTELCNAFIYFASKMTARDGLMSRKKDSYAVFNFSLTMVEFYSFNNRENKFTADEAEGVEKKGASV